MFGHNLVEKTARLRDDGQCEGEGVQPTTELLPITTPVFEQFLAQVQPGDVFTLTCAIERD